MTELFLGFVVNIRKHHCCTVQNKCFREVWSLIFSVNNKSQLITEHNPFFFFFKVYKYSWLKLTQWSWILFRLATLKTLQIIAEQKAKRNAQTTLCFPFCCGLRTGTRLLTFSETCFTSSYPSLHSCLGSIGPSVGSLWPLDMLICDLLGSDVLSCNLDFTL